MSESKVVIGVVGAGAMGSGIAQIAAGAGHHVILGDANPTTFTRAHASIVRAVARDVAKGRLNADAAEELVGRIADAGDLSRGYREYAECGLVIEAVVEDLAVKRAVFADLEKSVTNECVLASNTSSLSIAAIGGGCARANRVLGVHFFNPAPVMPLVEIVPGVATSQIALDVAKSLVDGWKKTTVIASDTPGFIVNRIARPFYSESLRQLEEGIADAATIDWAMRECGGFRMGPFELMDFIGNDVNFAVTLSVFEAFFFDPRYRPALTQRRLVDAGLLGRKSGRGYFDYREGAQRPEPTRDEALGQAIVDRTLAMLANSAVDAVHMRVASAADIEVSMMKGVNYPKGLLAWGDEIGANVILARLDALREEYQEERYRASPLLRRIVREGRTLTSATHS